MSTRTGKKVMALSISRCIMDMVEKNIMPHQVDQVVSGTACKTPEQWEEAIEIYCAFDWQEFPNKAREILRYFLKHRMIWQPRLSILRFIPFLNLGNYMITESHWKIGDTYYYELPDNWQTL